jgi:hypothetical protein
MGCTINPTMADCTVVRRARKPWACVGRPRDAEGRPLREPIPGDTTGRTRYVRCGVEIPVGALYVEYLGESALYESGARYCVPCARGEGLVE